MNDLQGHSGHQHLNDHWDIDHPFERLLVDTAVAPDPTAVTWINPRLQPGERRRVVTGIPGKTGVVYTLDRETGEFLWARPTVAQNVISAIDGATGAVTENAEVVFRSEGQEVMACPTWHGGKDWEAGAYSPMISTMAAPIGCQGSAKTKTPPPPRGLRWSGMRSAGRIVAQLEPPMDGPATNATNCRPSTA